MALCVYFLAARVGSAGDLDRLHGADAAGSVDDDITDFHRRAGGVREYAMQWGVRIGSGCRRGGAVALVGVPRRDGHRDGGTCR